MFGGDRRGLFVCRIGLVVPEGAMRNGRIVRPR